MTEKTIVVEEHAYSSVVSKHAGETIQCLAWPIDGQCST